jgi:8-oxo-dGTP pyrophosphatase MutT (NUDIX family)
LLIHPTNAKYWSTYSIPKGHIEDTETPIETAIRETEEEVGVKVSVFDVDFDKQGIIDYKDRDGVTYKRVHYFVVYPKDEIILDKYKLQLEEVSWAGFLPKQEAEKRINPKLKEVLKYLK